MRLGNGAGVDQATQRTRLREDRAVTAAFARAHDPRCGIRKRGAGIIRGDVISDLRHRPRRGRRGGLQRLRWRHADGRPGEMDDTIFDRVRLRIFKNRRAGIDNLHRTGGRGINRGQRPAEPRNPDRGLAAVNGPGKCEPNPAPRPGFQSG